MCNVCVMGEALLGDMMKIQITELVEWLCTPAWWSEVLRTRTSVGGPSALWGCVTTSAFILIILRSYLHLVCLHHEWKTFILKTKLPIIAYTESKWLCIFLRTFERERPLTHNITLLQRKFLPSKYTLGITSKLKQILMMTATTNIQVDTSLQADFFVCYI